MTVNELIKASLRLLGRFASGETPDDDTLKDCREALNLLLDDMQHESLFSLTETQNFTVSSGTLLYTIGPSQTWNGNKPLNIISAFLRDSSGYDTELSIIGEVEYLKITDKDVNSRPNMLLYVPGNTTGTVYLYPEPDAAYTIYLLSQAAFTQYTSGSTTISLPAGYKSYLKYQLAVEIAPEFEMTPSPWILKQAERKLEKIMSTNIKDPEPMGFDPIFTGSVEYNIQTDSF